MSFYDTGPLFILALPLTCAAAQSGGYARVGLHRHSLFLITMAAHWFFKDCHSSTHANTRVRRDSQIPPRWWCQRVCHASLPYAHTASEANPSEKGGHISGLCISVWMQKSSLMDDAVGRMHQNFSEYKVSGCIISGVGLFIAVEKLTLLFIVLPQSLYTHTHTHTHHHLNIISIQSISWWSKVSQ